MHGFSEEARDVLEDISNDSASARLLLDGHLGCEAVAIQ
jgi:hypothetical protein